MREKGQPRGIERERLRGKIRKRENLGRVLIANMTRLNSPPAGPPTGITLELVRFLLNYAPIDGAEILKVNLFRLYHIFRSLSNCRTVRTLFTC